MPDDTVQQLQQGLRFNNWQVKYHLVADYVRTYGPRSVIDWGCSNGDLYRQLKIDFEWIQHTAGYDPGNIDHSVLPQGEFESLVSLDVIEHFEPHDLRNTLALMQTKFTKSAYLLIACYPAKKFLTDGRNAHLIVENQDWWLQTIRECFDQCVIDWHDKAWMPTRRGPKPEFRCILSKT